MKEVNSNNFGLLIAYLIPGFVALWGVSPLLPAVARWLSVDPQTAPTISGFLYGTIFAVATGLIINCIRWHLVDPLHHAAGVPRNVWKYPEFAEQVPAFQFLIASQFRYYECYANTLVAVTIASAVQIAIATTSVAWTLGFAVAIQLLLWNASRRTLTLYHERIGALLSGESQDSDPSGDEPAKVDILDRRINSESESTFDPPPGDCYNEPRTVRRRIVVPILVRRTATPTGIH